MSETPKVMESMSEAESVGIAHGRILARLIEADPHTYQDLKGLIAGLNRELWGKHFDFTRGTPPTSVPEQVGAGMVSMVPALAA